MQNEIESVTQVMRALMPVAEQYAYFDNAAVAPISQPAADAMTRWTQQSLTSGDFVWPEWARSVEATRKQAAQLINATPGEIALVPNTTAGINLVAEGIDWQPGDNVVVLADEYPSNLYPWMHQHDREVETRMVATTHGRLDLDRLREACDSRTRVVSVSWIGFSTGYRQDIHAIAEIAHAAGAQFFLDAIQGLGVFPIDVQDLPVDFLAADGHKWMLGPEGAGVAYIRRENLERLRAIGVGWNSVVNCHDFSNIDYNLKPTADRYEGGSPNMPGMLALGASLEMLSQWPTADIAGAILDITDLACERLQSAGAKIVSHRAIEPNGHDPRSGIVSFDWPGEDPVAARGRCVDAGIILSCRAGRLRISAHAYNNEADVDRLIAALENK